MSDTPVLELTTEDPLDFSIGDPDDVAFSFDQADTLDADLGNPELVVNTDHAILSNRDLPDQHPMQAITGLENMFDAVLGYVDQVDNDVDTLEETVQDLNEYYDNYLQEVSGNIEWLQLHKQGSLVSGVNIKTIDYQNVLGEGNLDTAPGWDNVQSKPDFSTVATTGDYDDLLDKPELVDMYVNASGMLVFTKE